MTNQECQLTQMDSDTIDDRSIDDLPPAPTACLGALEDRAPATSADIAAETNLKHDTVQKALRRLRDDDLVETRPNPGDARQLLYELPE